MGQMMLVLGAFAMLSTLALSINGMMISSMQLGLEMEATMNAISIGQSLLDEILAKDFDEKATGGQRMYSTSEATAAASFGTDGSGEAISGIDANFSSRTRFDDVDDYHNYIRSVTDSRLGPFIDTVRIEYVSETVPTTTSSTNTFYKRITISVTNDNMPKYVDYPTVVVPYVLKDLSIYRRYF